MALKKKVKRGVAITKDFEVLRKILNISSLIIWKLKILF